MRLTFGQAKKLLAQYAGRGGKCPDAEEVSLFVLQILQKLLYAGEAGCVRKFSFHSCKGCITIPEELETPLKIKIGEEVGTVWDKFYDYHPNGVLEGERCIPAANALIENPNYVATAYDVPATGMQVGALATCCEEPDAHIIVQGKDPLGRVIYTMYDGQTIAGYRINLKKGTLKYSDVTFGTIDGILKSKTQGYVQLYGFSSATGSRKFLSDYSPVEESPQYRRFRLTVRCPDSCHITVLGNIRLKTQYLDNDFIPFENINAIKLAGQEVYAQNTNDMQTAVAKEKSLTDVIEQENRYKRIQTGQPIEYFTPLSGGSIRNILPGR